MKNHIQHLINEGEGQCLDFKFCITDSKKIARTLVAFSNSEGGRLLIGVKDNGSISGIQSDEEFYMIQAAAQMYCRPEIRFESQNWEVNGKTVLEIIVSRSSKRPHYALDDNGRWRVYVRSGDQNFMGNNIFIKAWEARKRSTGTLVKFTKKEKILLDYLAKNGSITLSKYRKLARISRFLAEKILVNFIVLEIITMDFTDRGIFYRLSKPEGKTISSQDTK